MKVFIAWNTDDDAIVSVHHTPREAWAAALQDMFNTYNWTPAQWANNCRMWGFDSYEDFVQKFVNGELTGKCDYAVTAHEVQH